MSAGVTVGDGLEAVGMIPLRFLMELRKLNLDARNVQDMTLTSVDGSYITGDKLDQGLRTGRRLGS